MRLNVLPYRELLSNLEKARDLHQNWRQLKLDGEAADNIDYIAIELKNVLRAITWDLEDLYETISKYPETLDSYSINGNHSCDAFPDVFT